MANLMPARDREASVATIDAPLTPEALRDHFLGREAYRRTKFIIVRGRGEAAVLRVAKASEEPLFSPIVEVEVMAVPGECSMVRSPEVDTANPTQMARAALALAPEARCAVVQGRYEHVSFILEPAPVPVRVVDVIPPQPPKLADQVRRLLDVADDLPPVEIRLELVDLRELAHRRPSDRYLFPCRVSGMSLAGASVAYLDERPPLDGRTLVGCARSREIYRWFYGQGPDYIEACPRRLLGDSAVPTLTKCCLLEGEVRQEGRLETVPWGATLDEVRRGLEQLLRAIEPAWSAA